MYSTNLIEALEKLEATRVPLDEQRVQQIVYFCLENLQSIGLDIREFEKILPISMSLYSSHAPGELGCCGLARGASDVLITINKHLYYEGLEDLLINTIYHELCHYFQFCEMVREGYNREDPESRRKYQGYFESNEGHSPCWWGYANRVNKFLKPTIKLTATVDDEIFDRFLKVNRDDVLFTIYCPRCNTNIFSVLDLNSFRLEEDRIIPFLIMTIEGGAEVPCHDCRGPIKIKYKDEETKIMVLKEVASYIGSMSNGRRPS